MAEPTENNLSDYLQDIGDFISDSAQQVADTDQEFMDEYYNEYPEKSANTALGILSAFPAAGGARLFNLIKNNSKALPNMVKDSDVMLPLLQTLGLGAGTLGSGIEMRERRENEADTIGYRRMSDHPDHPEFQERPSLTDFGGFFNTPDHPDHPDFQSDRGTVIMSEPHPYTGERIKRIGYRNISDHPDFHSQKKADFHSQKKANGGELSNLNEIYNLLNSEYVTREGLNPDTPKLDALAKSFLPVNEDGTLNYGEAAMAITPLGWVARLDKINDARRIAQKQFKVGVDLSSPTEQAAAKKVLDRLKRQEADEFTPKQLSEYAAMKNKKVGTEIAAKKGIATLRGTLETAGEVASKKAEQANIKGSAQGLDALFDALNK